MSPNRSFPQNAPVSDLLRVLHVLVLPSSLFNTLTRTRARSHASRHGYTLTQLSVTRAFTNPLHHSPSQGAATYSLLCERPGPGLPSCCGEHHWGFISPLFLNFSLIVDQQCPSDSLPLLRSYPGQFHSEAQRLPGPGELPGLLSPLRPQPCPLSHLSTCSETHTYMRARCASSLQTL